MAKNQCKHLLTFIMDIAIKSREMKYTPKYKKY